MRGLNLTLGTIVVMVVVVVTIIAILVYFQSGMTSTGEAMTGLFPEFRGAVDVNPMHWTCDGKWATILTAAGQASDGERYDTYKDCIESGAGCLSETAEEKVCKCKCIQEAEE